MVRFWWPFYMNGPPEHTFISPRSASEFYYLKMTRDSDQRNITSFMSLPAVALFAAQHLFSEQSWVPASIQGLSCHPREWELFKKPFHLIVRSSCTGWRQRGQRWWWPALLGSSRHRLLPWLRFHWLVYNSSACWWINPLNLTQLSHGIEMDRHGKLMQIKSEFSHHSPVREKSLHLGNRQAIFYLFFFFFYQILFCNYFIS